MKDNEFFRHEIKEITAYILIGIVMTIIIPLFIGFGLKAFEESFVSGQPLTFGNFLVTYMIYYIFIIACLIGLPVLKIREMFVTKRGEHPANQKNPDLFSVAIIHDVEQDGLLYNLFEWAGLSGKRNIMRWSLSIFRCFIIASLIFGGLGIFQVMSNTAFTSVPQSTILQQITPASKVFFSAEPPAFAETGTLLIVFCLLMGFVAWTSSKLGFGKAGYFFFGVLICIVMGLLWMGFHSIVYGNSEAKLFSTFIFGSVGSLLTLLTGTFIFWYVWHFWNNIFVELGRMVVVKEDLILISIIVWFIIFILYVTSEIFIYRFKKKHQEFIPVPK